MDMDVLIHLATNTGNLEEVMRLVEQDPHCVNRITNYRQQGVAFSLCPLHTAAICGQMPIAAYLIEHGANVNYQMIKPEGDDDHHGDEEESTYSSLEGVSALHLATTKKHVGVVGLLLEKGADPTVQDGEGSTPLVNASKSGSVEVVKLLVAHPGVRATINHRVHIGATALVFAAFLGHHEVVKLLLEAGADPTIEIEHQITCLKLARLKGRDSCVRLLEEWERSYVLTKIRTLMDTTTDHRNHQLFPDGSGGGSSSSSGSRISSSSSSSSRNSSKRKRRGSSDVAAGPRGGGEDSTSTKRARVMGSNLPMRVKGRMEEGGTLMLPQVEVANDGTVEAEVMEYTIRTMKRELFMDFMELLG